MTTIPAFGEGKPNRDALKAALDRLPQPTGKYSDLINDGLMIRFEVEAQLRDDTDHIARQGDVVEADFTTTDERTGFSFEDVMPDDPIPNQAHSDSRIEQAMIQVALELPQAQRNVVALKVAASAVEPSFRVVSDILGKSPSYAGRMWGEAIGNLGKRLVQRYAPGREYIKPARCPRRGRYCRGGDCPHTRPLRAKPEEKVYRGTRQRRASSLKGSRAIDRIAVYSPSEWWGRDRVQYPSGGASPPGRFTDEQKARLTGDFVALRRWHGGGDNGTDEPAVEAGLGQAVRREKKGVRLEDLKPEVRELFRRQTDEGAAELRPDEVNRNANDDLPGF